MKKYPWYLYLVSLAIAVVTIALVMLVTGILSLDFHAPPIVTTLFPNVAIAVVSVWAFLLPRKLYDKRHSSKEELENKVKYPLYLYLISIGIGVPALFLVIFIAGTLSNYVKLPDIVGMLFPTVAIAVVSVWAYLLPRKVYDKKHAQQKKAEDGQSV